MSQSSSKPSVNVTVNPSTTARNRNRRNRQNQRKANNRRMQSTATSNFVSNNPQYVNLKKAKIAPCTRSYIKAIVNPFGDFPDGLPCIPDTIVMPSQKVCSRATGTFSTGTAGVGFVSVNPWMMIKNDSTIVGGGDNTIPVLYTTAAYPRGDYTPIAAGVLETGIQKADANISYDSTFMSYVNRQFRLVGAGLKVKYTGSNFRNQGTVYLARAGGNLQFPPGWTAPQLMQDNQNVMLSVSRIEQAVCYVPDDPFLLGYHPLSDFATTLNPNIIDRRSLLVYIDGGDTETPQNWSFEVISYFEIIGPNLTYSPSHADPVGAPVVTAAIPIKIPQEAPQVVENNVLRDVASAILTSTSAIVDVVGPPLLRAGVGVLKNLVSPNSGRRQSQPMLPWVEDVD